MTNVFTPIPIDDLPDVASTIERHEWAGDFVNRIEDSLWLIERMRKNDFWFSATYRTIYPHGSAYEVRFRCVRGATRGDHFGIGETLSHAIARAACKVYLNYGDDLL